MTPTRPIVNFAVNVHDWTEPAQASRAVVELGRRIRCDFYVTEPVLRKLSPAAVAVLADERHGLCYHTRPPHPSYQGFGSDVTPTDAESYHQDLRTGRFDRKKAGGYTYVAAMVGRLPLGVSVANAASGSKGAYARCYAAMGAQMVVWSHPDREVTPRWSTREGMVVRPNERLMPASWWNDPDSLQLGPGFNSVVIHENNVYRQGPEGWQAVYAGKGPPWDLTKRYGTLDRDPGAILQRVERLAAEADVWTVEDVVRAARRGGGR